MRSPKQADAVSARTWLPLAAGLFGEVLVLIFEAK
jgi:hypothetical protein